MDFWTNRVGLEIRTRRSLGPVGSWIEIAPPGAESYLVLYPKALLPDWGQRKPSIVFECDDVAAAVAIMKARGVTFSQEPKTMQWGPFAAFLDSEGCEHGPRASGIGARPPSVPAYWSWGENEIGISATRVWAAPHSVGESHDPTLSAHSPGKIGEMSVQLSRSVLPTNCRAFSDH